jgi:hypothetical protein
MISNMKKGRDKAKKQQKLDKLKY